MSNLDDWKRTIQNALDDAGISGITVETKLDGENKVFAEITYKGRTADGLPDLVLSAIDESKTHGTPINEAFESRNMFAGPI